MAEGITEAGGKTRLYVTAALGAGLAVPLSGPQAHYLLHVMRARAGQRVTLFNGRDGEWLAEISDIAKRGVTLTCRTESAAQAGVPNLWLVFAPRKTEIARLPDGTFHGICTLSCITPETTPGASP